jgi:hypothetical protein
LTGFPVIFGGIVITFVNFFLFDFCFVFKNSKPDLVFLFGFDELKPIGLLSSLKRFGAPVISLLGDDFGNKFLDY